MIILSIETSCDETAIAVLDINPPSRNATGGQSNPAHITVRANIVSSQIKLHAEYGGVVPNLAAREHTKNIAHVLETALKKAEISNIETEIDVIAVTYGPGLGPALLVGLTFAKTLAWKYDRPLVGVDHMRGHIYSNWLSPIENSKFEIRNSKITFPILNLVVSGGHTELVLMTDYEEFKLVGETMDDAVGEAFDKVARLLDLGYPGGPAISKIAVNGDANRFPLPSPMIHSKDFNFSYSGLKTAVLYLTRNLKEKGIEIDEQVKADIAASFQKAAVNVLIQKTFRAAKELNVSAVFLSGGVSANTLLRDEIKRAAEEAGLRFSCPPMEYTTDNAAMIGVAGYFSYIKNEQTSQWELVNMQPNLSF